MTLPRTVADVLSEHVVFEVECIDRMYLNVYVPQLQHAGGLLGYVQRQLGLQIASTAPLARITDRFTASVHRFAGRKRVPWVDFARGQRKDDVMHEYLAAFEAAGRTEGVLFIGRAQEKTPLFRTEKRRDREGKSYPWIVKTTGMVNHFPPSFRTFCGLVCGFLAQTGKRTVCGMLAGAGLSRAWPHDRAHWFFSRARWSADDPGLAAAKLVVTLLVPAGEPVTVAIDDTLFRRRGKKVWAAGWFHDGSAPGPAKTGYGNTWVIAAIVVKLPALRRPVAVPVLAKLVIKNTSSASRLWLGRRMTGLLASALPGRHIHVVTDSAYAGGELKKLPPRVTWTTRLHKDAALYGCCPALKMPM